MTTFAGNVLLVQAKAWLRAKIDEGARCPCCNQMAKVYKRKINSGMAKALIVMYKHAGTDWFYLPDIRSRWQGRDEAVLRYFGLIEEATERRDDGGRAGWWRVTDVGQLYVLNRAQTYKYARVYDGKCLGLVGDLCGIKEALGDKFDYSELMRA